MGIVNRRNAVLGWGVWSVSKRVLRRKAKGASPKVGGGRRSKSLIAVTGAAVIGGLTFWRKRRGGDES